MTALPFTAPANYDEARAMMGKTFVTPDGVERKCDGAGYSGDRFSVSFGPGVIVGRTQHPGATWSSEDGFETYEQRRDRTWDAEADTLKANEAELVKAVFGEVFTRSDRATKLKSPKRLVTAALVRLVKDGKIQAPACSRCRGSGQYSYNQINGTTCFGCNGSGKMLPKIGDALKAARA
jgi:DnaJ-class molecular chaperone